MLQIARALTLVMALVLILSVVGVSATWLYALDEPTPSHSLFNMTPIEFEYRPEDVLPGTEENQMDANHQDLIENVLNHMTYGLNFNVKPLFHEILDDVGIVYCEQHTTKGQIKKVLIDGTDAANVRFVLVKLTETVYHIYTYHESHCDSAELNSTEILVYKTLLVKGESGKWGATESYIGYAQVFNPGVKQVNRAVNVSTWHM